MVLSTPQLRALRQAARRHSNGRPAFICPIGGVYAASETAIVNALRRRGLATDDPAPVATDEGLRVARESMIVEQAA